MSEKKETSSSETDSETDSESDYEAYTEQDVNTEQTNENTFLTKKKDEKNTEDAVKIKIKKKYEIIAKCFNNVKPLSDLAKEKDIPIDDLKKCLKRNEVYHIKARKISKDVIKQVGKEYFDKETISSIKKIMAAKKRSYMEVYAKL